MNEKEFPILSDVFHSFEPKIYHCINVGMVDFHYCTNKMVYDPSRRIGRSRNHFRCESCRNKWFQKHYKDIEFESVITL